MYFTRQYFYSIVLYIVYRTRYAVYIYCTQYTVSVTVHCLPFTFTVYCTRLKRREISTIYTISMVKTIKMGWDICGEARYYSVLTLSFHTALLFGPLPYNLTINTAQNLHFLIYLLYNLQLIHRVSLPICRNVYLSRGPSPFPPGREQVT